jgi:hypothetical protein
MIPDMNISRIDDVTWNTYDETVNALIELYQKSNKQIFCQPSIRVLENTMIVGVLTITNQFIQLNEPEHDQYEGKDRYGLDKIEESNYIENDKIIAEGTISEYKDKMIHKLKLEKKFYNAYFNILKIEINKFKNITIRQRIEEIIKNSQVYPAKIEQIKDLLFPIIERKIDFITYSDAVLVELEDINLCKKDLETDYCTPDGLLLVPSINLYTKQKNNELYLLKFIDGILRNHNVKLSVFEQSHSTIYYTDKYNLTDQEILMLESLLIPYLDKLGQTVYSNDRVTYLSFEDLQPEEILNLADIVEVEYESPELIPASDKEEDEVDKEEDEVDKEESEVDESDEDEEKEDEDAEAEEAEEEVEEAEDAEEVEEAEDAEEVEEAEDAEEEVEEEAQEAAEEEEEEESEEEVEDAEEEVEEAEEDIAEQETEDEESSNDSGENGNISESEEIDKSIKLKPKIVFKKPKEPEPIISSPEEEFDLSFEPKPKIVFKKSKETVKPKIVFKKPINMPENSNKLTSKDMLKCIDRGIDTPDYPTEKWKKLLPKKTKRFRIKLSDDFSCNFLLLIYVLKDFDKKYANYKISDIKKMLISSYNRLAQRKEMILSKWMNEEKQEFAKKIKKKNATFETIILSPNYFITTIDIVLLIHFYKIPIVLLYQQKGKVTTLSMENEKNYHYFIKAKTKNQFFLHYIDSKLLKTLRFNEDELSQPMLREINPIRLLEYFENKKL